MIKYLPFVTFTIGYLFLELNRNYLVNEEKLFHFETSITKPFNLILLTVAKLMPIYCLILLRRSRKENLKGSSDYISNGLLLSSLGDFFLLSPVVGKNGLNFQLGLIFFAIAHLVYVLSFLKKLNFNLKTILALIYTPIILSYMLDQFTSFPDTFTKNAVYFYMTIIAIMHLTSTFHSFPVLLGSFVFIISDSLIGLREFGGDSNILSSCGEEQVNFIIMVTYYLGQFGISFA